MEYYVYISDSKVDMLLPQILGKRNRKVSREITAALGPLTAKQTSETQPAIDRVRRLELVVQHLRSNEELGTIDLPGPWIEDELELQWGTFREIEIEGGGQIAWFAGTRGNVCLGMGGSMAHVLGHGTMSGAFPSGSMAPTLVSAIQRRIASEVDGIEHTAGVVYETESAIPIPIDPNQAALFGVSYFATGHRNRELPQQRMRFVAKRLQWGPTFRFDSYMWGEHIECNAVLATPLFVSQVD